jgi:uncharacterized coiled-coil DUF342 family protein
MGDLTAIGTIVASIGGTLAAIAKDRSDRVALVKDVAELKTQVTDLADALDQIKARVRGHRTTSDPAIAGMHGSISILQKRYDEFEDRIEKLVRRADERDKQELALQRELGGIGAKIEVLLAGK